LLFILPDASLGQPVPGYPDSINAYDPREVAMLPEYCKYTNLFRQHVPGGNDEERINYYRNLMGPTASGKPPYLFETMHHYCWALMKTNRGTRLARTKQAKIGYLNTSLSDFDYVIRNAPRGFPLLPEILTRKGENLIRLGKPSEALRDLEKAIELKPDYWPPYLAISGYYSSAGDLNAARRILERGLTVAPDAKPLQAKLDELRSGK
jgi:tetratricopeptide (TPR) repeat protein